MRTIIIFLFISLSAHAQKVELLLIDENIDTSSLEDNFDVKKGSTLKSFLPPKDLRDHFLKDVPESKEWDEYEKDVFYMDLKNKSIKEITKKYPQFSKEKISFLKGNL